MPTTPTVLLFDADVLIKLAQHPSNQRAIEAVSKSVSNGSYSLVVPEAVKSAFVREIPTAPDRYWKAQQTHLRQAKLLIDLATDEVVFQAQMGELQKNLDKLQSSVPETVKAMDGLIALGHFVPTTDLMLATAARWAQQERAPAERYERSSLNDCVVWQIVLSHLASADVIFCSDNYKDFSDPIHRKRLHPTLASEASATGKKLCYHDLEDFQAKHLQQVRIVAPAAPLQWEGFRSCPACGSTPDSALIPRPSSYGGWSYQQHCSGCGKYIDTGEPYDD